MTKTLKYNNMLPLLFLAVIILIIPQLNNKELMDSTQRGKAFGFLCGMLGYIVMLIIIAAAAVNHRPVHIKMLIFQLPEKGTSLFSTVRYTTLAIVLFTMYPTEKRLKEQYQACKTVKYASDVYSAGAYLECFEDFEMVYPNLKTNGVLLVQYGKAHENSIVILKEAKLYLYNIILCTCLGNNYNALDIYTEAENAFVNSLSKLPV